MNEAPPTNGKPLPANKRVSAFLRNPTRTYRSSGAWWGYASSVMDGAPYFTWFDIPRMLRDPQVRFLERMWRAPFQRVKWAVKSDDPKVAKFVGTTLRRFWRSSLPKLLSRYFRFGFAPGGAEFVADRGAIRLERVRAVEPQDASPLMWAAGHPNENEPAGFKVKSSLGQGQDRWVGPPHAFWFAGYGELSAWFDMPPLAGLFEPWIEKRGRQGAVHSRRLWFRKCAFGGGTLYYPDGSSNYGSDENPQSRNNEDIARELMDYDETGSVRLFVNDKHADGTSYAWDYKPPEARSDVSGVRDYPKDLDEEMAKGVGITPEVLEAADVGSGWSGRLIPLMGFLGGVDELAGLVIEAADQGWLRHLVKLNFGDVWYEIEALSLAEEVQTQAKAGKGGSEGENPAAGMFGGSKGTGGGWKPYKRRSGGTGWKKGNRYSATDPTAMSWTSADEAKHVRDSGKFASKPGGGAVDEPESGAAADPHASKVRQILRMFRNSPRRAVKKARTKVHDTYQKLEQRYGPGYAKVIVGAGVASLPVPIPGAAIAFAAPVLAIAELHRRLSRWNAATPEKVDHEGVVKPGARWFLSRVFGRVRGALHLSTFDPAPSIDLSFTGVITDTLGRERHYKDGKQIAGPSGESVIYHPIERAKVNAVKSGGDAPKYLDVLNAAYQDSLQHLDNDVSAHKLLADALEDTSDEQPTAEELDRLTTAAQAVIADRSGTPETQASAATFARHVLAGVNGVRKELAETESAKAKGRTERQDAKKWEKTVKPIRQPLADLQWLMRGFSDTENAEGKIVSSAFRNAVNAADSDLTPANLDALRKATQAVDDYKYVLPGKWPNAVRTVKKLLAKIAAPVEMSALNPDLVLKEVKPGIHRWVNPHSGEEHELHPETGQHAHEASKGVVADLPGDDLGNGLVDFGGEYLVHPSKVSQAEEVIGKLKDALRTARKKSDKEELSSTIASLESQVADLKAGREPESHRQAKEDSADQKFRAERAKSQSDDFRKKNIHENGQRFVHMKDFVERHGYFPMPGTALKAPMKLKGAPEKVMKLGSDGTIYAWSGSRKGPNDKGYWVALTSQAVDAALNSTDKPFELNPEGGTTEPVAPLTAAPPTGLSSVFAGWQSATGKAKHAIETALWNADAIDDAGKPTKDAKKGKVDPAKLARTLASAWQELHDDMTPEERGQVETALTAAGVRKQGEIGDAARFDGRYHEGPEGSFTGSSAVIERPGLIHELPDGREVILVKAKTGKS